MSLFFSGAIKAKELIHATFRQLPLFLIGTLFILGLMETNISYLFLVIGSFLFIATTWISQAVFSVLIPKLNIPLLTNLFMSPNGAMQGCSILGTSGRAAAIAGGSSIVAPSYFIGFLSFFFTYVFRNAYELYQREPASANDKAAKEKIDNRKYQAGMAMFLCVLLFLLFSAVRMFRFSGCERPLGALLGMGIGIPLAMVWYNMLHYCGGDALSDLFGIIGRLVPTDAKNSNPVACVVRA
jgi:hypothetical protein